MPCEVDRGSWGTVYTVPEDTPRRPTVKHKKGYNAVEGWWTDTDKGHSFLLRQENNTDRADVLELSHGQLYDLIDALNQAIGLSGPKVGENAIT